MYMEPLSFMIEDHSFSVFFRGGGACWAGHETNGVWEFTVI